MRSRLHIIAEAGTNHNGSVDTGRKLIDVAVAAHADSVKFQMIFPAGLYLPRLYVNGKYEESEVFSQRTRMGLSPDDWRALAGCAAERGIPFSTSVFDREGIALLDEFDAPYIKIASCDVNNPPLLRAAAQTGRKLVISTGMATLKEIQRAVHDLDRDGHTDIVLMHCVSVYPCPLKRMNLGFIDTLRREFAVPVGLSDHTETSLAAAIAVTKGVDWIEKHFTLDRGADGFDHAYAMEPDALRQFVSDVDAAVAACQPTQEKVAEAEATIRCRARRGLYAARDLLVGETLTEADVLIVRPAGPLAPTELPNVLGCTVSRGLRQYEALTLDAVDRPLTCAATGETAEARP